MSHEGRVLLIRFTVPDGMTDGEAEDAGEQIATDLISDYGLGHFDGTEVVDES